MTKSWLDDAVDFAPVVDSLQRRWSWLGAALVAGAIAGYGLSYAATAEYEATGTLYVLVPKTYELSQGSVNLGTFQSLLLNRGLIAKLIEDKGLDREPHSLEPHQFIEGRLRVTPLRTAEMLKVTFTLPDAALAADVVNALIDRAITLHRDVSLREEASVRSSLEAQRREAEARVEAAEERLRSSGSPGSEGRKPGEVHRASLQAEYDLQVDLLREIILRHEQIRARVASHSPRLEVIDRAVVPARPVSPSRKGWALVGAAIGLLMGMTLALSRPLRPASDAPR